MVRAGRRVASEEVQLRGARLAAALRSRREQADWSQDRLAEESGVKRDTLRAIEEGRTHEPGFFNVVDLARELRLVVAELVDQVDGGEAADGVAP
jgi:transcriptional regulator with XRE-family HTH domain